jgi:hypothetical protein
MPRITNKQRKLAEMIVENAAVDKPLNGGEMLAKVGYSPNLVKQPGRVIEAEGVQTALAEMGFTEQNAKNVVAEILLNPDGDANVRLNAAKEVFKVKGSYAAEKTMAVNLNLEGKITDEEAETLRLEYEQKLKDRYLS